VKVATGADLLKLLVNVLFELKIDNHNCNIRNLKKNLSEEHYQGFLKLIDAYDKTFKTIKFFRNKSSHEAKFYDDEFERLAMFDNLYRSSKKFEIETESIRLIMPKGYLEFKIKELRTEKIEWITEAINAYEIYIDKIIENSIYIYFKKYREWLNKNNKTKNFI